MKFRHACFLSVSLMLLSSAARAAQSGNTDIAPFVDDQTLVIVRVEVAQSDPAAALDWLVEGMKQQNVEQPFIDVFRRQWKPAADRSGQFLSALKKAGVKRVYWVLSLQDLWTGGGPRGLLVAPTEGGADVEAVMRALSDNTGRHAQQIGPVVVAAAADRPVNAGHEPLAKEWSEALSAGADAPIHIAFVPTTALRLALEANLPTLPLSAGPQPVTTLTRGVQWVTVSIALPPKANVKMVAHCADISSARAVADFVDKSLPDLRQHKEKKIFSILPAPGQLAELMKPTVDREDVRFSPDAEKQIRPIIASDAVQAARERIEGNMKYLLQGFVMYQNNFMGKWAPDLPTMIKFEDMTPSAANDPLYPQQQPGYIYIQPAPTQGKDEDKLVVLYEAAPEGRYVGYADGHVERLASRQAVEQRVNESKARNDASRKRG